MYTSPDRLPEPGRFSWLRGLGLALIRHCLRTREGPPDTGGGRVFSLDATSGLLATVGAIGAGAVLVLSTQPLWCELYDMQNNKKNKLIA